MGMWPFVARVCRRACWTLEGVSKGQTQFHFQFDIGGSMRCQESRNSSPFFQATCALRSLMAKKITTTKRAMIRHVTRKTNRGELALLPVSRFRSLEPPGNEQHEFY